MLGNANGTFTPGQQLLSNLPFSSVAAGDVNGDGKIDLVAGTVAYWPQGSGLQVFAGNGNGTFQAWQFQIAGPPLPNPPHWLTTGYASAVTIADVDADGKSDLVVECQYEYPNSGWDPESPAQPIIYSGNYIGVLRGNGNGTFTTTFASAGTDTGLTPSFPDVQLGDLNGDGQLDLVVAYSGWTNVLLGAGNATFSAGPSYHWAGWLALADFNADGKTDVATIGLDFKLALGDGNGGFAPPVNYPAVAPGPRSLATADFNLDGHPDLLVGTDGTISANNVSSGKIIVLLNNRAGGFDAPLVFPCGPSNNYAGAYVLAADFNGDARPDIAATSTDFLSSAYPWVNNIRLLINDGNWPVKTWIGPASGGNWSTAANWSPGGVPIASDVVSISASTVTLSASATIAGLTLTGNASLTIAAGGNRILHTSGLSIGSTAKLNLNDNDLIFNYSGSASALGSWNGSAYTGVTGQIQSGRNDGAWNGNGIVTGMSAATSGTMRTTIAAGEASQMLNINGSQTAPYRGQVVDATTVIVKYTYMGDVDLDGAINGDDYFWIDSNVLNTGLVFGYSAGDINLDGEIKGDDYFWLDSQILSQV